MPVKDTFVITYGSTRWGWKFETGVVQKIYKTQEEAIHYAKQAAKPWDADVYIEQKDGKFKKLSELDKPASSKPNSKRGNRKDN